MFYPIESCVYTFFSNKKPAQSEKQTKTDSIEPFPSEKHIALTLAGYHHDRCTVPKTKNKKLHTEISKQPQTVFFNRDILICLHTIHRHHQYAMLFIHRSHEHSTIKIGHYHATKSTHVLAADDRGHGA